MSGSLPGLSQSGRACQGGGREVCDKMLVASVGPRRPLPHPHSSPAPLLPSLPTPVLPQIPSLPPAQSLQGEETPGTVGLRGAILHPGDWQGCSISSVPFLSSAQSFGIKQPQTQTHLCFFLLDRPQDSVTLASEFLGGSGKFRCLQGPGEGQGGQVWNSVPFGVPQPHSATAHHQVEETRV